MRFFFADLSLLDLVGSTYGSSSKQYVNQFNIIDGLIELFFKWLEKNNLLETTSVIISSDHGMSVIDHSYRIFNSEKYVPLIITGAGIKRQGMIKSSHIVSILDYCSTICYLLGVNPPKGAYGRVLIEAIESSEEHTFKE